jgi:hypothetical protein
MENNAVSKDAPSRAEITYICIYTHVYIYVDIDIHIYIERERERERERESNHQENFSRHLHSW